MISIKEYKAFKQAVSARELYAFLAPKAQFTNWCNRMFEYGFEENDDYILLNKFVKQANGHGGHNKVDYFLTIDCAKEIAMLQRSDKGKQARKYFIGCEKKLHSVVNAYTFTESINAVSKQINEIKQMGSAWGKVGASLKRTKKEAREEFKRLVDEAQYSLDLGFYDDLVSKEG